MIAALWMVGAASAGGFLQVGTGQQPLQLPTAPLLAGGGLRLGYDVGPVVPFVGGSLFLGRLTVDEEDDGPELPATQWSAQAGLRLDLASEDGPAQGFLSAGATVGSLQGGLTYPDFDEATTLRLSSGPGAFLGAGADAFLTDQLAIGIEVGGAWTTGSVTAEYRVDGRVEDKTEYDDISALYTWADLHLVFRLGRKG
jgi:hypothetical protein